jgi:hypothetical protein
MRKWLQPIFKQAIFFQKGREKICLAKTFYRNIAMKLKSTNGTDQNIH